MKFLRKSLLALLLAMPLLVCAVEKLDINTADSVALANTLQGVGEKRAALIVQWREQHGPFKSLEELLQVKGVGQKILDQNRERITIGKAVAK